MTWALTIIVVMGAVLPFAAWRLERHLEMGRKPSAHGLGPPADAVDKWLIDQHRLPAPQRWQVRNAVLYGRTVRDPALRHAAHELAGCALRRELRLGRSIRVAGIVLVAEGVVLIAMGIALLAALSSPAGIVPVLLGAWLLAREVMTLRKIWRGPSRAYRLNT